MKYPLKVCTLGSLTIQRDNVTVTGFISRKVEALFVYLLCEPREHGRELLAEFFWDDLPQARSMANLRMALYSLQQQLAPYITVTRQTIAVNSESEYWLDVKALESALAAAEQMWERNGSLPRATATRLQDALKLYHGDFLAGFHIRDSRGFEDWKLMQQEQLRSHVVAAMDRIVRHHLERGEYAAGIEQANRLLQLDPLREEAHRQLMILQVGAGHRSAAAAQYETCRRILKDELGVEPETKTTLLYEQIVQGVIDIVPAPAQAKHNLPYSSTPFVERPKEQAQIGARIDDPRCRLLTLLGPGGTGKTRLALHTALERVEDYADGVYLISLAPVQDARYLLTTIAATLKLKLGDDPLSEVADYLNDKHMLLVLDNFEHLIDGADAIHELLSRTKWLKCLVTSRERLNLHEEWLLPVSGLDYPATVNGRDIGQYGAVKLFIQSAQRTHAFTLAGNEAGVSRICHLVEGMPLGIELAASWTRIMSCDQIAARIERDLGFLETNVRNVPERHRSIRVLFEHSFTMLPSAQQDVLMRLSVFRGGFALEGAEQVAGAAPAMLLSLTEKSLIRGEADGRYHMHELLRRFAYQKLIDSGQIDAVMRAFAAFFVKLTEAARRDHPRGEEVMLTELDRDYNNILSAMEWALQQQDAEMLLRLTTALALFYWRARGYFHEGGLWLEQALNLNDPGVPPHVHFKALGQAGSLGFYRGDLDRSLQRLEESLRLYEDLHRQQNPHISTQDLTRILISLGHIHARLGNHEETRSYYLRALEHGRMHNHKPTMESALLSLAGMEVNLGDMENARRYLEESILLVREQRSRYNEAVALYHFGYVMMGLAEYTQAVAYFEESLTIANELRDKPMEADIYVAMGEMFLRAYEYRQAREYLRQSLVLLRQYGDKVMTVCCLEVCACLFVAEEEFDRAALLFGMAEAAREGMNALIHPRDAALQQRYIALARQGLGEVEFAMIWTEGREMTLLQAIEYVLHDEDYATVRANS